MTHNTLATAQVGTFTEQMRKKLNHNIVDISTLAADKAFTSNTTQATLFTTDTLEAGKTYHFELLLGTTMTTNGGLTLEFNTADTLTLTSIVYITEEVLAATVAYAVGTTATMATKIIDNKTAAYIAVKAKGSFVVNAAGKMTITAAQNTSHADTTTIAKGSTFRVMCDPVTVDAV
jgi:hypothetical protein